MNLTSEPMMAALGSASVRNSNTLVIFVTSFSELSLTVFLPFFLPIILTYLKLVSFTVILRALSVLLDVLSVTEDWSTYSFNFPSDFLLALALICQFSRVDLLDCQ